MRKTPAQPTKKPAKTTPKRTRAKDYQPYLGALIEVYRHQRAWSQDSLAANAAVHIKTIAGIEAGQGFQMGKLGQICTALELDLAEVLQQALAKQLATAAASAELLSDRDASAAIAAIAAELDGVDQRIGAVFGGLLSPTRAEDRDRFSARRLVSSLSILDIPLDVILLIVGQLPDLLEEMVTENEQLTTTHIRSAVARAISGLSPAVVQSTEASRLRERISAGLGDASITASMVEHVKFDWASRYARRYGNPDQVIEILERDGQARRLDYVFLKSELIPHALKRLLGREFEPNDHRIITGSVVSAMAESVHSELLRLGLYTIRYKTALLLVEDLAVHPPHPWMVTPDTRLSTVAYDLDRADANLLALESGDAKLPFEIRHRYEEVVHHLCSATLALYGGFLGLRGTSSIYLLKHWLTLEATNMTLWENCDLRHLTGDLATIGVSKQALDQQLKRLDPLHHTSRDASAPDLALRARRFMEVVKSLVDQRKESLLLAGKLEAGRQLSGDELIVLVKHTLISQLGARKIGDLHAEGRSAPVGLTTRMRFDDSILAGRPPLTVVVYCLDQNDPESRRVAIADLLDQLDAHRLSSIGLIVTGPPIGKELRDELAKASRLTANIVAATSVSEISSWMRTGAAAADFLDLMFGA